MSYLAGQFTREIILIIILCILPYWMQQTSQMIIIGLIFELVTEDLIREAFQVLAVAKAKILRLLTLPYIFYILELLRRILAIWIDAVAWELSFF